ncbi:hypothetical protein MACJ_002666 [Theileria orientalis]|uniref:Uncharacterized protein n=1 Tax=Theileria orientalis TaxID=68886 RepID=A0A976M6H7_THEOR|nr:hypothetical protein MACJ_002666 [Theileria orientalis]
MSSKENNTVTYQLEKTGEYECVSVVKEEDNPEKGFIKCTHTPSKGNTGLNSCIQYNNGDLMSLSNTKPIESVQNQIYKSIIVFFCISKKLGKNKDNEKDCVPLLVELNKEGAYGPEYYVHRRYSNNSEKSYWVELSGLLKDILPQLGLGTNIKQFGFYLLRALLGNIGVIIKNPRKISDETLNKIQPYQLKKLLEQNVGDIEDNKPLLNFVLFSIKFELSNSIIIFLEKRTNEKYDVSKIKKFIKNKDESTILNTTTTVSFHDKEFNQEEEKEKEEHDENEEEDEDEESDDEEDEEGDEDLHITPFKYYTHKVTEKNRELSPKKENKIEIAFFILDVKIETYNKNGTEIECVYYEENDDKVYVFFYDEDPRPLLVVYQNKAFRPKNPDSYYTKWVSLEIEKFEGATIKNNTKLKDILFEIAYELNPVKLEINDHGHHAGAKYIIQRYYKAKKIANIETEVFGDDMNCHKEYTHQAGSPDHPLGEISHNGNKLFNTYQEYKNSVLSKKGHMFPYNVTVYYYMYDYKHLYPLMIELHHVFSFDADGYKNSTDEFYKLSDISNNKSLKWVKISDDSGEGGQNQSDKNFLDEIKRLNEENREYINGLSDSEDLGHSEESPTYKELAAVMEKKLKEIRENLQIVYEKKPKNLILATANNCREETNVLAIVGAVSSLESSGTSASANPSPVKGADSNSKTGVELSLEATTSTNEFNYKKDGKIVTYTAKDSFSFKSVKTSNTTVWSTTNASEYATKVVLNGKGKKQKEVTIHLPNNTTKVFKKEDKNSPWNEVTQEGNQPSGQPASGTPTSVSTNQTSVGSTDGTHVTSPLSNGVSQAHKAPDGSGSVATPATNLTGSSPSTPSARVSTGGTHTSANASGTGRGRGRGSPGSGVANPGISGGARTGGAAALTGGQPAGANANATAKGASGTDKSGDVSSLLTAPATNLSESSPSTPSDSSNEGKASVDSYQFASIYENHFPSAAFTHPGLDFESDEGEAKAEGVEAESAAPASEDAGKASGEPAEASSTVPAPEDSGAKPAETTPAVPVSTPAPTHVTPVKEEAAPPVELKLFKDDGNGNAVEMVETTDYEWKDFSGCHRYGFKEGVQCVKVMFGSHEVWKKGDKGVNEPKSVSYNSDEHNILVFDDKKFVFYKKDNSGNWVHDSTIDITSSGSSDLSKLLLSSVPVKLFKNDPSDSSKIVEMESSSYDVKGTLKHTTYMFKEDAICSLVKCDDKEVWKTGENDINSPKFVTYYNNWNNTIAIGDGKKAVFYHLGDSDWKHLSTIAYKTVGNSDELVVNFNGKSFNYKKGPDGKWEYEKTGDSTSSTTNGSTETTT